jgi:hypothetical protein
MKPTKRKRMGRPPMRDPRRGHIVIRVNKAEGRAIRQAANAAGMRLGEYVRSKLIPEVSGLDKGRFWKLIAKAKKGEEGLRRLLRGLSPQDLIAFQKQFTEVYFASYHWDLWGAAYVINGGCSNDGFDYFRGGLILQGRKTFENAVKNTESLERLRNVGSISSEAMTYMARQIYEEKTGSPMPRTGTLRPDPVPGRPWKETDLKDRFPKLWRRFWLR